LLPAVEEEVEEVEEVEVAEAETMDADKGPRFLQHSFTNMSSTALSVIPKLPLTEANFNILAI